MYESDTQHLPRLSLWVNNNCSVGLNKRPCHIIHLKSYIYLDPLVKTEINMEEIPSPITWFILIKKLVRSVEDETNKSEHIFCDDNVNKE
jgi:hypothetical protein